MFGSYNVISATNGITPITENGVTEQRNSFIIHFDTDLSIKTVSDNTVRLFDTVLNDYVDVYVSYSKRDVYIVPKLVSFIPGRKYTIQIIGGLYGIKDIVGGFQEEDVVYDIVFNDTVILKKPIVKSPAANSTVNSVSVIVDYGDSDSCIVEIDDNIKFSSPLYTEEVFIDQFVPAYAFENKQYYVRAKAKKAFVDESTGNTVHSESEYSAPLQFFYDSSLGSQPSPDTSNNIYALKSMPEDSASLVSNNTLMFVFSKDLTPYTVTVNAYSSELNMYDFYKESTADFIDAGVLTSETGTTLVSRTVLKFTLDSLKTTSCYFIKITIADGATEIFNNTYSFTTAARTLYIDYDYIKSNVTNFDVDKEYVMDKVQRACDMADYVSASKIRPESIKFKVKEYVRNRALLDIVTDYQLGYIDMVKGTIGTFSFELSNANVSSVESAINQLNVAIKYWETTLKGYEKPGNAAPDFAVRGGSGTAPSRTSF